MDAIKERDAVLLKNMVPIKKLAESGFKELISAVQVFEERRGTTIFNKGDTANDSIYLLDGILAIVNNSQVIDQVEAGSDTARFPIAHQLPRKFSGRAMTKVRFVRIDSHQLSELLVRNEDDSYEVSEYADRGEGDWMSLLLSSSILQQIPAANMQGVMMSVEHIEVEQGEVIIRQGDPGNFYYVLSKGRASVTRDMEDDGPPKDLGVIDPGTPFGEEAILSDSPRKATITMLTPGEVLRLSKQNFLELIQHPLSRSVDYQQAKSMIEQGAIWLDVRKQKPFEKDNIEGSINLPFESLRYQASNLAPEYQYIVISETGKTAVSAAFLLTERGLIVAVLNGGYAGIKELALTPGETAFTEAVVELSSEELAQQLKKTNSRIKDLEAQIEEQAETQKVSLVGDDEKLDYLNGQIENLNEKIKEKNEEKENLELQLVKARQTIEEMNSELSMVQAEAGAQEKQIKNLERRLVEVQGQAESAEQRMDGYRDRLTNVQDDKSNLIDQYDRDLGKLKEEIMELRMAIDLAEEELAECQDKLKVMER